MTQEKTAMRELWEWVRDSEDKIDAHMYSVLKFKILPLLHKEKDQIRKAYNQGGTWASEIGSEAWFDETFTQE